jgi:hypothetical protein
MGCRYYAGKVCVNVSGPLAIMQEKALIVVPSIIHTTGFIWNLIWNGIYSFKVKMLLRSINCAQETMISKMGHDL